MAYKIIVSPIAQMHIDETIEYYMKKASVLVASKFYNELQDCYKNLELNPFNQIRIKTYRAVPLDKFHILFFTNLMKLNAM